MDKQNIFNNYLDYMYNSTNKQYEQTIVLVDKGVIELKPKEYEPEQLKVKFEKETKPTKKTKKTKKVKRSIEFNDPSPVLTPINSVPEVVDDTSTNVKALLGENDFYFF